MNETALKRVRGVIDDWQGNRGTIIADKTETDAAGKPYGEAWFFVQEHNMAPHPEEIAVEVGEEVAFLWHHDKNRMVATHVERLRHTRDTGTVTRCYSCFISYSSRDQEFANRLYADLQNNEVRCWFAPHDIRGGRKLHEQIDEAIRLNDRLLLILSEHSMNSEWVKTEIANARQCEVREKRQALFPITLVPFEKISDWKCFDADTGKDSAREIREYFIPDFSNWKDHDSYQSAFQRLVRDLKAGERGPTAGR